MLVAVMIFSSCASLTTIGVGRVKRYTLHSDRLPPAFDSITLAFISDIHYPSKFTRKRLGRLVAGLNALHPDMLLLGGDYVTANTYAEELFSALASVKTNHGIYAVRGNHENNRRDVLEAAMARHGVHLLADTLCYVVRNSDSLRVAGVADSFDTGVALPFLVDADDCYTILLAHTPDYAQDVRVQADIVLSGHTHGGQVSLFGIYTPVKNTHYGTRFLRGLNYTDSRVPVITTNGVGTSRRKVRFCVPSEIVLITLRTAVGDEENGG